MDARGRDAAVELFTGRLEVLGPSNYFTHDKLIEFDDADPDHARGTILSHAEINPHGQAMLAAIRYRDCYRREGGVWRISERVFAFFYYVATEQYLEALGAGLNKRMRAYADPMPADIPEGLDTWKHYYVK